MKVEGFIQRIIELPLKQLSREVFWKHRFLHKIIIRMWLNPMEVNITKVTDRTIKKLQPEHKK